MTKAYLNYNFHTQPTEDHLIELAKDLGNWARPREIYYDYPQFSADQIKRLITKRDQYPGLSRCYRMIGRTGYLNRPLFGLYLAGMLPEQQEKSAAA